MLSFWTDEFKVAANYVEVSLTWISVRNHCVRCEWTFAMHYLINRVSSLLRRRVAVHGFWNVLWLVLDSFFSLFLLRLELFCRTKAACSECQSSLMLVRYCLCRSTGLCRVIMLLDYERLFSISCFGSQRHQLLANQKDPRMNSWSTAPAWFSKYNQEQPHIFKFGLLWLVKNSKWAQLKPMHCNLLLFTLPPGV